MAVASGVSLPPDALFLGFDCSTQSLKATALDHRLRVVASAAVSYDAALPVYGTRGGVVRAPDGSGRVTASPLMWLEALEMVLAQLQRDNFPFKQVAALSGSGQQHGSVYWRQGARQTLRSLRPHAAPLAQQLASAFSTTESPVWMDSSTAAQCRAIEDALGGAGALAALTGSSAHTRFTGPQIRALHERSPSVYASTERISLVSSFLASVLAGDYAPIDCSDAAGMNLMDVRSKRWATQALEATAPGLADKLGEPAPSHTTGGTIAPYFAERFGFSPECEVVLWSGDNPCSLAGLCLADAGDVGISLGTSDTVFGVTADPRPAGGSEGHIFPNPVDPATYMAMLCYSNGSLTREEVRDRVANGSWDTFNALLGTAPPLNGGCLSFCFKEPEILPPLPAGMHRFAMGENGQCEPRDSFAPSTEVRALVEGQFLSMRAHAERIGMPTPPRRLIATGGGSKNEAILEVMAAVFGGPVYVSSQSDSASLGAALRAAHGWLCRDTFVPYSDLLSLAAPSGAVRLEPVVTGSKSQCDMYSRLLTRRVLLEEELLLQHRAIVS